MKRIFFNKQEIEKAKKKKFSVQPAFSLECSENNMMEIFSDLKQDYVWVEEE